VDFMRLGEGATIRVNIPIHVRNTDQSPGVKRGGTVSIVTHSIEVRCRADAIPTGIEVDVSGLDINHSRHLSDIKLPEGVRVVAGRDITLVTVVPPSGYAEEMKAAAEAAAAAAAAAATAAAAPAAGAGAAAPAAGAPAAGAAAPAAGAAEKK
jgi:large subunit ribosomal protein L25